MVFPKISANVETFTGTIGECSSAKLTLDLYLTLALRLKKMNIYVGNLAYSMSEDDLREAFEAFGSVDSARIIMDRETNRSKGFGFVEMSDDAESKAAIEALNESEIQGRKLVVNEARPRQPRSDRGGYGRGGGGGGGGGGRGGFGGGGGRRF